MAPPIYTASYIKSEPHGTEKCFNRKVTWLIVGGTTDSVSVFQMGMSQWIMWSWTSRRCWSWERRLQSPARAAATMLSSRTVPAPGAGMCAQRVTYTCHSLFITVFSWKDDLRLFLSLFLRALNHYPLSTESCKYLLVLLHNNRIHSTYPAAVWCWCWCLQSQMTVRSGPVMMMNLSPLPLELHSHWL